MTSALAIVENVPLAPFATLGVGGPARYFLRATDARTVADAADWAASRHLPIFVWGGGSNVVVADEGYPGLVLHMGLRGLSLVERPDALEVVAGAAESWDDIVAASVARGAQGLECLSGIPGQVGATPIQNVGAYGQEVADVLSAVDAFDLETGRSVTFERADCGFGYRDSRFKSRARGRHVLLWVRYRLRRGAPPTAGYPDVQRELSERGVREPGVADVRAAVLAVRRRKSMVVDAADPCSRSVGSFFTNPIVPQAAADEIEERLRRQGRLTAAEAMPEYAAGVGRAKLPAAWLIERCGFDRGTRRGPVGLSQRHTLAIVNYGAASAADVVALAREIRDRVRDVTGLALVPEPVLVGVSL